MMSTMDVSGITMRYRVDGDGPWLVLSHSLGTDLSLWDEQMPALTARYRVLRFDTRGHGGSSAPALAYDFQMLTADTLGLMDALGVGKAHFVGISMGGMIAQHVALAAPARIDRLVLASTTSRYAPEAKAVWQQRIAAVTAAGVEPLVAPTLERWFTPPFRAARPDLMARIGGLIRATPAAGYIGCCHAIAGLATTAALPGIALPTLVIAGADDVGTPPAMGREIAAVIPGARFESIADASHLCNVEQAAIFNRLLADFLA
jgi:3-oxoadipate enol-lactonase